MSAVTVATELLGSAVSPREADTEYLVEHAQFNQRHHATGTDHEFVVSRVYKGSVVECWGFETEQQCWDFITKWPESTDFQQFGGTVTRVPRGVPDAFVQRKRPVINISTPSLFGDVTSGFVRSDSV